MAFILGVLLFALGIAVTIALHEWGHLTAARLCGMRVRRYFVGFGPTLFSFKRRHAAAGGHLTEYGVKAIPFGGFCDIAGMTAQDPIRPEEEPYAMYRKPAWQRLVVLSGGVVMNLIIGIVLIYIIAVSWGLPNLKPDLTPRIAETMCVTPSCTDRGPAADAGIKPGDVITAVNGEKVSDYPTAAKLIGTDKSGAIDLTIARDGAEKTIAITPQKVERETQTGEKVTKPAIGIAFAPPANATLHYGPVSAIGATFAFTSDMFGAVWDGLLAMPQKIPGVVASIFGGSRDPESPMSVVGASRAGGELVERDMWAAFVMLLANLNFFLALFNFVPLPPLDGGHALVVIYEKIRDAVRRSVGKPAKGPADYTKLMPVTLAFTAVLLIFGVLVMTADVVNPVRLFG